MFLIACIIQIEFLTLFIEFNLKVIRWIKAGDCIQMFKFESFHFLVEWVSNHKLKFGLFWKNIIYYNVFGKSKEYNSPLGFKNFLVGLIFREIKYQEILWMLF